MFETEFENDFIKKYCEKQELSKTANKLCFAFIITGTVMVLWSYAARFVYTLLGYDIRTLYAFLQTEEGLSLFQIFISTLAFLPVFSILAANCNLKSKNLGYNKPKSENLTALILFGMSSCGFVNICTALGSAVFKELGINYEADIDTGMPMGFFGFLLAMISTAVVPALIEEFALRGVVLNILKPFGEGFAIIISSVLFGLMHGNFEQMPFTFAIGLCLGYVTVKSGSILPAVFIHFFNNGANVVIQYAVMPLSDTSANLVYYIYLAVLLILGIVSILFIKKEDVNLKKSDTSLSFSEKMKCFLLSPMSIVYIIVVLAEAFLVYAK